MQRDEGRSWEDDLRVKRLYQEADRIITDATSPEAMANNPYRGKPIALESNPYDRGWGMAFRMLKNSGHKLPWMEAREEIMKEKAALADAVRLHAERLEDPANPSQCLQDEHDRFLRYLADRVGNLREKIAKYNLEVPLLDQQLINVRVETFTAPYRKRFAHVLRRV